MRHWHVVSALCSPTGILKYSYKPNGVLNAVCACPSLVPTPGCNHLQGRLLRRALHHSGHPGFPQCEGVEMHHVWSLHSSCRSQQIIWGFHLICVPGLLVMRRNLNFLVSHFFSTDMRSNFTSYGSSPTHWAGLRTPSLSLGDRHMSSWKRLFNWNGNTRLLVNTNVRITINPPGSGAFPGLNNMLSDRLLGHRQWWRMRWQASRQLDANSTRRAVSKS